jgi:hypothetical protein
MPNESTKRFAPLLETPPETSAPPQEGAAAIDEASLASLRAFFELLDIWDQRENHLEK